MLKNENKEILKHPYEEDVSSLASSKNGLNSLVIENSDSLSEELIRSIPTLFPNLEELILLKLSPDISKLEFTEFGSIRFLDLRGSKELRTLVLPKNTNLKILQFRDCFNLTLSKDFFSNLSSSLIALDLRNVLVLSDSDIEDFVTYWKNLEILDISESDNSHGISNISVKLISENCENLEILKLNGCKKIDDSGISKLSSLRSLRHLEIRNCPKLGIKSLREILKISSLKTLDCGATKGIFSEEQKAIDLLMGCSCFVENLRISFIALKEDNYVLLGSKFKELDFSWSIVNDFVLKKLGKLQNPVVEILNLSRCKKLSNWGFLDLVKFATNNLNLKKLILRNGSDRNVMKGLEKFKEKWPNCEIVVTEERNVFEFRPSEKKEKIKVKKDLKEEDDEEVIN